MAKKHGLGSGGHVVCAIFGPLVIPGEDGQTAYHYSLLRTLEDGLGVGGHVGNADTATPINTIWK